MNPAAQARLSLGGGSAETSASCAALASSRPSDVGAETTGQALLSVWSWYASDPATERDLVFVVATYKRGEVGWVCRQARLPNPAFRARLRPFEPGFAAAMAHPFSVRWMPLDEFARRSDHWLDAEQLVALRSWHP